MNSVGLSYLLCFLGFVSPINGLHRFYNKKYGTGILWLFTFGLCGVGQFVDLFFMQRMVEEHNGQMRAKLGLSDSGVPVNQAAIAASVYQPSTHEQLMNKLLKAAAARGGKISVTQGALDTGASFMEVEAALKEMVKTGYVNVDNHPVTGVVIYDFIEL